MNLQMFTSSYGSSILPYVTRAPTIVGRIFSRGGAIVDISREAKNGEIYFFPTAI